MASLGREKDSETETNLVLDGLLVREHGKGSFDESGFGRSSQGSHAGNLDAIFDEEQKRR